MAKNVKQFCLSHSILLEPLKWYQVIFSFFQNSDFFCFYGGKRAKNDSKPPILVRHVLYLRNCRWYDQVFVVHRCKTMISPDFFKKYNIANIKILTFFIGLLQQFSNKWLFFKYINKCQKEILSCALHSSDLHDFSRSRKATQNGPKILQNGSLQREPHYEKNV